MVEEPQNRRTRVTKGLKVSLFPGLSPSALKVPSGRATPWRPACPPAVCRSLSAPKPCPSSVPAVPVVGARQDGGKNTEGLGPKTPRAGGATAVWRVEVQVSLGVGQG